MSNTEAARIYLSPPDMTGEERAALLAAFDSNWIAPLGPDVDAFEGALASRTGRAAAAVLSSGTAALHLGLVLLEVGPEDEVWTATMTFAATANAIRYVGASPVFLDSERESWNLDPNLLRDALRDAARRNALPKVLITVDLYGQCADYDAILETCHEHGVSVIEDAAEALGASCGNRPAGSFGNLSALSFNGNKIITTSGGGALVGDDDTLIARARYLAAQAKQPLPYYEHTEVGYNYRMSNLLAAVGRAQLERLDAIMARRRRINATYREALASIDGIRFVEDVPGRRSNCWLTCVLVDKATLGVDPESIRLQLESQNIESRRLWKPMHLQPEYRSCRIIGREVSEDLFARGLCLPSGSTLTEEDQQRVIDTFLETPGLQMRQR